MLETKWGLIPDMSGIRTLTELVGLDQAKLLTMTGETFSGERAHSLGLVTELAADPVATADALVERLLTRSPDAVAAAKRLFDGAVSAGPRRIFARERAEQLVLLLSANTRAAREAAFARQTPVFSARRR